LHKASPSNVSKNTSSGARAATHDLAALGPLDMVCNETL
jgi:hypothetical protein